jgi:phosphatidylglycerol:prolipoprotein diacylglycerol transferase
MVPLLSIAPSRAALIASLFAALAVVALAAARRARRAEARMGGLFAAYLAGVMALVVAAHGALTPAPLRVSSYALMLVAGVLTAWGVLVPRLLSIGLPRRLVFTILLGCLGVGLVGSRVVHMLSTLPRAGSLSEWVVEMPETRRGGLGVFGALAAGGAFLWLLFRRHPEHSLAAALDAGSSAIAVNLAFGRVGCLLAGCCYGDVAAMGQLGALPVRLFDPASPAHAAHAGAPEDWIWATQPMEALFALALALLVEALFRRSARAGWRPGTTAAIGLGLYGVTRATIESLRADSPRDVAGLLTVWQVAGLLAALGALAWGLRARLVPTLKPS